MSETISWADFEKVVIAVGTVVRAERNEQARKPALKVWVDFGPYGEKKTSAQIAALYTPEQIVGRQVVGVINFPPKQIGPFMSEFLLTVRLRRMPGEGKSRAALVIRAAGPGSTRHGFFAAEPP